MDKPYGGLPPDVSEDEEFVEFTEGVRADFHEPDEQGIRLVGVVGSCLDNAMGSVIAQTFIVQGCQECVIVLERRGGGGSKQLVLNLATVLGWARCGLVAEKALVQHLNRVGQGCCF